MNSLISFSEGCNEGIMGKETEGRDSTVKRLYAVRGGGVCVCWGGGM